YRANGPELTCTNSMKSQDLQNGDLLEVTTEMEIHFLTPMLTNITQGLHLELRAQRTIIKDIVLNSNNPNDSDYDGLDDQWEIDHVGDITIVSATDDPDHDGCNNGCEETRGGNPAVPDTDGDGLPDGKEAYTYHTKLDDVDTDDDGLNDGDEISI